MAEENNGAAGQADAKPQVEFALQRVYLKDLSFEAPQGAAAFKKQWKPKVNQDLRTEIKKLDDNHYDVILHVTITVKDEEETMYLVEVQQAGIFLVKGIEGAQLNAVLNTHCPQIVFPYVRETVDNVVNKGTFPSLMLPPINFEAVYQQILMQQKQKAEESETVN
jgi:preprotein translocase subunit SecB